MFRTALAALDARLESRRQSTEIGASRLLSQYLPSPTEPRWVPDVYVSPPHVAGNEHAYSIIDHGPARAVTPAPHIAGNESAYSIAASGLASAMTPVPYRASNEYSYSLNGSGMTPTPGAYNEHSYSLTGRGPPNSTLVRSFEDRWFLIGNVAYDTPILEILEIFAVSA